MTILHIQNEILHVSLSEQSYKTMENQYCKVGTITPMTNGRQAIHLLEFQYQNFMDRASNINDAKLVEYFEGKAQKIQRILENLV